MKYKVTLFHLRAIHKDVRHGLYMELSSGEKTYGQLVQTTIEEAKIQGAFRKAVEGRVISHLMYHQH